MRSPKDVVFDKFARRVLLFLTSGLDKRFFHLETIEFFGKVQKIGNLTSKKDWATKQVELSPSFIDPIVQYFTANPRSTLGDKYCIQLLSEIIVNFGENSAAQSLVAMIVKELDGDARETLLKNPVLTRAFSRLIDKKCSPVFTRMLMKSFEKDKIVDQVLENVNIAFIVLSLLKVSGRQGELFKTISSHSKKLESRDLNIGCAAIAQWLKQK